MPKAVTLGNGRILVGLDKRAQVRDFYFPYVGLENHVSGHHVHRVGVWVDGNLRWFDDPSWNISVDCDVDTGACLISARNEFLGVQLNLSDVVYNEKDIFIREITVLNLVDRKRELKVFFGQQFRISESRRGDTGYYDPRCRAIIHYKGNRAFLINLRRGDFIFNEYSVGLFEIEGKEGTHMDALDGKLSKNPIEHGSVDSVLGITLVLEAKSKDTIHYWITVGKSIKEVQMLNTYVIITSPQYLMKTTNDFWNAWVNRQNFSFYGLDDSVINLFKKSLLIIRAHADNGGAIIASCDSDMLQHGRDTYSYMWPRDGAITALALARSGSFNTARRFFNFCNDIVAEEGYFMHKYLPDGSLGSSWHPWIRDGNTELPIQGNETALVLYALWEYYKLSKDLEFVENIYNSLIRRSGEFLMNYTYKDTDLPYPSYDIWEEKYGIASYTCTTTYGALIAASEFANLLGKEDSAKKFKDAAEKLKIATLKYLYCDDIKMFCKLVNIHDGKIHYDKTIDMSSFYGAFKFGMLPVSDKRVEDSLKTIESSLSLQQGILGVPRYVNDNYYRTGPFAPSNPWFITTLWRAQYYIAKAENEEDMKIVKDCFEWVTKYALPSGVLSEQLNPFTGDQLSAAPLTWSHAEFVNTVIDYLNKLETFGVCNACSPIK